MSTNPGHDVPCSALFGKTRLGVLALLYGNPDESFYTREVVRIVGAGHGAVQRELKRLTEAGILRRSVQGNQVHYQANANCPIFPDLERLVLKTGGTHDLPQTTRVPVVDRIDVEIM